MLTKKKMSIRERLFILSTCSLLIVAIWQQIAVHQLIVALQQSTITEIKARLEDRRMLRSRTGFQLPGFEPRLQGQVIRIANVYGSPWFIGAAVAKNENGGDGLEFGIQQIDQDIRLSQSPDEWQTYQFYRMLNRQVWKIVVNDPLLLNRVLENTGQSYNHEKHNDWMLSVFTLIQKYRELDPQKIQQSSLMVQDEPSTKENK